MNPSFSFQENVVWICEGCGAAANKITPIPDYDESVHQDPEEELYQIENPVRDLLNSEIDPEQNILGDFWLERGACNVIVGPSGVGKSVVSIQGAIEAAAGLPVFGMTTSEPLRVVVVQAEDSRNDRITQVQCINQIVASQDNLDRLVQSIPTLDEVYSSENLPPIAKADAVASGERRMLQQMGIADLPERLQVVQTRTYQSRKTAPAPKTNPF
jgi:AAA domain